MFPSKNLKDYTNDELYEILESNEILDCRGLMYICSEILRRQRKKDSKDTTDIDLNNVLLKAVEDGKLYVRVKGKGWLARVRNFSTVDDITVLDIPNIGE